MDTTLNSDWWPSPAKLNLFLHITGRNDKGYHLLQTLFQMLDTGDSLAFVPNDSGDIRLLSTISGVNTEDNLIYRAARLLQEHCKVTQGCDIRFEKQLPMGGGIGGGSSNAATTLVALNHYWQCNLSTRELAGIGLSLGADVPIFVHGRTAFAAGVGEQIYPVNLDEYWYLVVFPGVHVSTAEVFGHDELPRNTAPIDWQDYTFDATQNDCQKIVCKSQPEVANLLQWLVHYAPSRMTGTGACVFATFSDPDQARAVQQALPAKWSGFVAKGVNISPLQLKLQQVSQAQTT
ncbi:4-(cytidine 5'-diphospho)-2-C-methyl-D-erythritol kinase [Alteromonas lipolytica]|uniref:4-diphosphocytidyl-2-C-methyl-D-erythritol kinase n=1 Tax=Alteromonas lipolytica TaxID=1856405 RepID=A0A1E8FG21_9ALTE|nr:4-(cytidine 5'-diphospho)-2-C-methyl-D-erythritol kinase [Alteromonas lipolytica]OFI34686.1 4-(cytidine 5'-diphospho)-2-C-methyl-D-erythritol kinase [Alteromonas lipolytica]GGF53161.1 4-diphosphocytidyl-2-C-methyl-D-erythritol kinase [Alteromonas lipolytica]